MVTVAEAAKDFLAQKRIAVAGVSRSAGAHSGNGIYERFKSRGYEVFAVNPNADEIDGNPCYRSLDAIPGGVDAVVIATAPEAVPSVVADCERLGITRVWMHRSFGGGSVSPEAATAGRKAGMTVIAGGCPLMFEPTSDGFHKCRTMGQVALPRHPVDDGGVTHGQALAAVVGVPGHQGSWPGRARGPGVRWPGPRVRMRADAYRRTDP